MPRNIPSLLALVAASLLAAFTLAPADAAAQVWPSEDGKVNEYTIQVSGSPIGAVFVTGGSMGNGWEDDAQYWAWDSSTTAWADDFDVVYEQQHDAANLSPPGGTLVYVYEVADFTGATATVNLNGTLNTYKVESGTTLLGYISASPSLLRAWRALSLGATLASVSETTSWSRQTSASGTLACVDDDAL